MMPVKPSYLKTYGKQRRWMSAWISPGNRRQAFDSSTDTDLSTGAAEVPVRANRRNVASHQSARVAKKRALRCLTEESCDPENITSPPPRPQPTKQRKKSRKARACVGEVDRAVKRTRPTANSSDEENFQPPRSPRPPRPRSQSARQSQTNRAPPPPPPVDRFVTRRQCSAASTAPACTVPVVLDSSDDLTAAGEGTSAGRRGVRSVFVEISLSGSADHRLNPRKPIFCSTPNARRRPIDRLSPPPESASVSSIALRSTCDLDSMSQLPSAPPEAPHSDEGPQRSPAEGQDQSADLFMDPIDTNETSRCCQVVPLPSEGSRAAGGAASDSCGHFVSADRGSEWLLDAVREKRLTQHCEVQLERSDHLSGTQTSYSSCLGDSGSVGQRTRPAPVHTGETADHPSPRDPWLSPGLSSGTDSEADPSSVKLNPTEPLSENGPGHRSAASCSASDQLKRPSSQVEQVSDRSVRPDGSGAERQPAQTDTAWVRGQTEQTGSYTAETLTAALKEKCLKDKVSVEIRRISSPQMKGTAQPEASDRSEDHERARRVGVKKSSSTDTDRSGSNTTSEEKRSRRRSSRRRSTSTDRPATTRKACVNGLSVSRWTNRGALGACTLKRTPAVDGSIHELIPQPQELFRAPMNFFSTPEGARTLNLSSLLADLTPDTHSWSRLKAALSVHRRVLLTPRHLRLSEPRSSRKDALADLSRDLFTSSLQTPLVKRLGSTPAHSSLLLCEDEDLSDAEKVCAECGQKAPLSWDQCIPPLQMKRCVKIGEGTFGEVFSTTNASGDTVALKVIPVEGREKVNGENQKTFGEILHEIIISKELSSLKEKQQNQTRGFIGLNDLHCVRGSYPAEFLKAWDTFDQKKGSENDRPDFFQKDQMFLILEFEFGGSDLENSDGTLASLAVAKSVLHQVTAALAVAEQELRFEHRDLHWGNVLVKSTKEKKWSFLLNGTRHSVDSRGVLIRIIDYSLSRLEIDELTVSCDISEDEELFLGRGDYQFDIYRLMRQENGNSWTDYHPRTNVLWLHYLCSKLLTMKYRGSGGRTAKDVREELARFYDDILQCSSATAALQTCSMFQ